tara:strand:- start:322 stop:951 length:630 start_codon:yes stop_codon:yes gene_type:complete
MAESHNTEAVSLVFDKLKQHPWNAPAAEKGSWKVFLFKRIVHLSESLYVLEGHQCLESIPLIFRALFEAQVDLFLILQDENYCRLLEYQELKGMLKIQTDPELLSYGIKKVQGSTIKKNKIRVRELEEDYSEHVKGFNFQRKLETAFRDTENSWESLYVNYRVMSQYVHGIAYAPEDLRKISKTCFDLLPVLLDSVLEKVDLKNSLHNS